jgi:hypothetical protein
VYAYSFLSFFTFHCASYLHGSTVIFSQLAAETADYLRACEKAPGRRDENAAETLRAAYKRLPYVIPSFTLEDRLWC